MIFTIDFDGTVVDHRYPDIGPELPLALDVLHEMLERKHRLILLTMRSNSEMSGPMLSNAVTWLKDHKVDLWGINENPEQKTWTLSPKPHADLGIDDKYFGAPLMQLAWMKRPGIDWKVVHSGLTKLFNY